METVPGRMGEECGRCRFWFPFDDNKRVGMCRRHSPKPQQPMSGAREYPVTEYKHWCGDYKSRDMVKT